MAATKARRRVFVATGGCPSSCEASMMRSSSRITSKRLLQGSTNVRATLGASSSSSTSSSSSSSTSSSSSSSAATTTTPTPTSAAVHALSRIQIVSCRPKGASNVGSIARVANNFGFSRLAFVQPSSYVMEEGSDEYREEVYEQATWGRSLLESSIRPRNVEEAVGGASVVLAMTVRRRNIPVLELSEAAAMVARKAVEGGEVALLLGNERNGLTEEEARWATAAVTIPTAKQFPDPSASLNLSHACAVMCYEILQAVTDATREADDEVRRRLPQQGKLAETNVPLATKQACQKQVVKALKELGCLNDQMGEREAEKRLARLLSRETTSLPEVALLFKLANKAYEAGKGI